MNGSASPKAATYLDDARLGIGGQHAEHRGRRDGAEAGRDDAAAADRSCLSHFDLPVCAKDLIDRIVSSAATNFTRS
jgi:hypothetical protein